MLDWCLSGEGTRLPNPGSGTFNWGYEVGAIPIASPRWPKGKPVKHMENHGTLPKTNSSPLKMLVSNRNLLFQGSIFRGELLVSGRVHVNTDGKVQFTAVRQELLRGCAATGLKHSKISGSLVLSLHNLPLLLPWVPWRMALMRPWKTCFSTIKQTPS